MIFIMGIKFILLFVTISVCEEFTNFKDYVIFYHESNIVLCFKLPSDATDIDETLILKE